MFTPEEQSNIFTNVYLSNTRQLSRKYNSCKQTCLLPIQCTFNIKPIFFLINGNYNQSSNEKYNTILTFTEDASIYIYVTIIVFYQIASIYDPNTILFEG